MAPLNWGAGSLHPAHPTGQKIAHLTEEWYEIRLKVDNFGENIQTFMSFIIFWLHKSFQIIVQ